MKILFASRYVYPKSPYSNHNILKQARTLKEVFKVDIEILTWPTNDLWDDLTKNQTPKIGCLKKELDGYMFNIFSAPIEWDEISGGNIIGVKAWNKAVDYGIILLKDLKPDVLHLHHRMGFWWLLESAQRLNIPCVYTNYDWGLACLRTILVNAEGELCDGRVGIQKCASCIKMGRQKQIAKLNENIVETFIGEKLLTFFEEFKFSSKAFRRLSVVSKPALRRTEIHQARVRKVIEGLCHCISPSNFGVEFFKQFGISSKNISKLCWPYDKVETQEVVDRVESVFTITYIGRVSKEKGVHLIFNALEKLENVPRILLRITGVNQSEYCVNLRKKYGEYIGGHQVEWLEWSPIDKILRSTDVAIIPSVWMDNTPMTLIESLAYKVPVIATSLPSMIEYLKGDYAYLADFNNPESLADAISSAVKQKAKIRARQFEFPKILSSIEYCAELLKIYKLCLCGKA
jgi:glycosyltransferase involved in cell wall biosynthesis